jgi:hypothetical protein
MMNVASFLESAARRTELDPFEIRGTAAATTPCPGRNTRKGKAQAEAEFGCVDWYQYQARTDEDNNALKKAPAAQ